MARVISPNVVKSIETRWQSGNLAIWPTVRAGRVLGKRVVYPPGKASSCSLQPINAAAVVGVWSFVEAVRWQSSIRLRGLSKK